MVDDAIDGSLVVDHLVESVENSSQDWALMQKQSDIGVGISIDIRIYEKGIHYGHEPVQSWAMRNFDLKIGLIFEFLFYTIHLGKYGVIKIILKIIHNQSHEIFI